MLFLPFRGRCLRQLLTIATVGNIFLLFVVFTVWFRRDSRWFLSGADFLRSSRQSLGNKDKATNNHSSCLLSIFTTFKPSDKKFQIYSNTLRNWIALDSRIKPIVYYTQEKSNKPRPLDALARQLGWTLAPAPRTSKSGVPYLKDMYFDAATRFTNCQYYGFSNADILYTKDLARTLEAVSKVHQQLRQTLIIGRRVNILFNNRSLYVPDNITTVARREGKLFIVKAEDFFFVAANEFPWDLVPDVVIGRPAYDNFLVAFAIRNNVSVVDASQTLTAVHQSDRDGNWAGFRNRDKEINRVIIGKFAYSAGYTLSSQFLTKVTAKHGDNVTIGVYKRHGNRALVKPTS